MFQVFLMYALFGSIFSIGKIGLSVSQPYFLTSMRMFLAGFILISYLGLKNYKELYVPKKLWALLTLVAFFNVFITNAFEFWGLQYMTSGKTCLIYSLSPFAAVFFAYFFGTETMNLKKWAGLLIGFVSFCPLMLEPWFNPDYVAHPKELMAEGALLVSAVTCVIGWHFVRKLTLEHGLSDACVNGYSFVMAGLMCLVPSFAFENWQPIPASDALTFLWTLLYIVAIHNLICYSIYAGSLRKFSITFLTFAGLSNPLFAGVFGWLFLGEELTLSFALALVGVAVGLFLFSVEEKKDPLNVESLTNLQKAAE